MDAPTRRWAAWLTATVVSFAVLEAHALREPLTDEKPSGTLSAALRLWLGIQPAGRRRWIAGGLFAAFWLWLTGHVCLGWPPNDLPRRKIVLAENAQVVLVPVGNKGATSGRS